MAKVLISGGSGLVGSRLREKLITKGYSVALLSRTKGENQFAWDLEQMTIEDSAFENVDFIIHLAGENVAGKRWSKKQKSKILNSRVKSGQLIVETLKQLECKPKAIISASGVGYYGFAAPSKIFSESDEPANDFLGDVCKQWEKEINKAKEQNIRTVNLRTGIVLSSKGGAFTKLNKFIKMGLGSGFGSGKQFMPWIHIDDLCDMYIKAIENSSMSGAYNAVAPEHINNIEFTTLVAKVQGKRILLPNVPGFMLKLGLGEMSEILLKGNKVSCKRIQNEGFEFTYAQLNDAIRSLI
mgnify:CR=1 FL=1